MVLRTSGRKLTRLLYWCCQGPVDCWWEAADSLEGGGCCSVSESLAGTSSVTDTDAVIGTSSLSLGLSFFTQKGRNRFTQQALPQGPTWPGLELS